MSDYKRFHALAFRAALALVLMVSPSVRAQWVQTNGPYGGRVSCLYRTSTKILVCIGGEVFASSDAGTTWVRPDSGFYAGSIVAKDGMLFATSNGVYRSTDEGLNWDSIAFGPYDFTSVIASSRTTLFVASDTDIFRSTDNGATWIAIPALSGVYAADILTDSASVYVCTFGGYYYSSDNGATWKPVGNGIPNLCTVYSVLRSGANLYAGTDSGLFSSSDNGANWAVEPGPLSTRPVFVLAATDSELQAGTNDGFFLSADSGHDWIASGLSGREVTQLQQVADTILAGTNGEGMYRSTDGGRSWLPSSRGMTYTYPWALQVQDKELYAGTLAGGIWKTSDDGIVWQPVNNGLQGSDYQVLASTGGNLYAGSDYYGLFRSTDRGAHWTSFNHGLTDTDIVSTTAIEGELMVGTRDSGAFVTSTEAAEWHAANSGLDNGLRSRCVFALEPTGLGLFAALNGGIFRSSDFGNHWTEKRASVGANFALGTDGRDLFLAADEGSFDWVVYRSSDSGSTWASTNIGDPLVYTFLDWEGNVFAGTEFGIYLTGDSGQSWKCVGTFDNYVSGLAVNDGYLFAANGAGVWRRSLSEMIGSSAVARSVPIKVNISARPNPFSRSVTILFYSAASSPAEITIVNILGAEVARLYDGELAAGQHSFRWDASDFAPGMYECVVRSANESQELPILLAR